MYICKDSNIINALVAMAAKSDSHWFPDDKSEKNTGMKMALIGLPDNMKKTKITAELITASRDRKNNKSDYDSGQYKKLSLFCAVHP